MGKGTREAIVGAAMIGLAACGQGEKVDDGLTSAERFELHKLEQAGYQLCRRMDKNVVVKNGTVVVTGDHGECMEAAAERYRELKEKRNRALAQGKQCNEVKRQSQTGETTFIVCEDGQKGNK